MIKEAPLPPPPPAIVYYQCVRWTWTGDVCSRKVTCLEWAKRKLAEDVQFYGIIGGFIVFSVSMFAWFFSWLIDNK